MNNLRFGVYRLDPVARQLWRGAEPIPLAPKAFDLLVFLASNPRRPLLKGELLEAVWPDTFVEESNLNQNVFLVRKALGADGESLVVTLPRKGYQFTGEVTEVLPAPVQPEEEESVVRDRLVYKEGLVYEEETEERILVRRSPGLILAIVAGVALLACAGWLVWDRWQDRVGGPPVQVVLADLDGGTGDPVLDRSLVDAMRFDLTQSPFVSVLPVATVRQTLSQMMRKPDDPLTASLARDLCERTASQVVLHGSVVRVGSQFLLNEEATNCVDGSTMAIAKQVAKTREDLPGSVEKLAETIRHGLGESRRMIARFDAPLFPVNTGSIEALENFSQANLLSQRGKLADAIDLMKRAVELDPKFAAAYLALANLYANQGDRADERNYIQKAYDLRETASAPTRLYIVAHYHTAITGDLFESLRNYKAWIDLYPRSLAAWVGLLEVDRLLGRHAEAIETAQHAIALNPHYQSIYYGLALEQLHSGDLAAARSTCELAISRGLDGDLIRMDLLRVAYLQHDPKLFEEQAAWADSHPASSHVLQNEASIALAEGRLADAHALLQRMTESLQQQGLSALANTYLQTMARTYAELGEVEESRRLLHVAPIDPEEPDELMAMAETGDAANAEAMLRDELAKHPDATLWKRVYAPEIRAAIALSAHSPKEAIAALEGTADFDGTTLDLAILRARAHLEAGQAEAAEAEYTRILSHPEIDPVSSAPPIARLGLAQALRKEGKPEDAAAYKAFFTAWSKANGHPVLLERATSEFDHLQGQ